MKELRKLPSNNTSKSLLRKIIIAILMANALMGISYFYTVSDDFRCMSNSYYDLAMCSRGETVRRGLPYYVEEQTANLSGGTDAVIYIEKYIYGLLIWTAIVFLASNVNLQNNKK